MKVEEAMPAELLMPVDELTPKVSNLVFFFGMMAVWIRFRNLPTLGSTSSGLMISFSSLNATDLRRFLARRTSPSAIRRALSRLLCAVLNSVRFYW